MKKKLAFFTPLPPTKSGISDYSVELAYFLKNFFQITFVISDESQAPTILPSDTFFLKYKEWRDLKNKKSFICFYHMGNNIYHDYIYDEILVNPGVTLFHDFSLHHLIIERVASGKLTVEDYYRKIYQSLNYNLKSNDKLQFPISDLLKFIVPLNEEIAKSSNKIIVHSNKSYNKFKKLFPKKKILKINFPYKKMDDEQELFDVKKNSFGYDDDCLIISILGFCTPTKQASFAMKALSRIKIKLKKFKFLIVGEVHESLNIDKQIKEYNLDKNVEIIGYTDFTTFKKYIIISDIILNLRYPSAGETSAVLLRSLGFGNVNIAFDYESFADFPDDVLVKIPLDTSDTYFLEDAITRLLDNKTLFDMYQKNSKQHIEHHHDISEIAKQLNDFL